MKNIYISGPVDPNNMEKSRAKFSSVAHILIGLGHECINPMENSLPDNVEWSHRTRIDLGLLLFSDAIYMMKGWERSERCKLELAVATSIGLPVFFEDVIKRHHLKDAIFD